MTRECHVRFCERLGVKAPRPTHHVDGYAIWYKRLEKGTFRLPTGRGATATANAEDLWALLSGVDLSSARRGRRYRRPSPQSAK